MITEFGKYLRKLRIDRGEIALDMANALKVTPSFLSAVEVGKKNVPSDWVTRIVDLYSLPQSDETLLGKLAKDAVTSVKINLSESSNFQRKAALVFARDFNSLSPERAAKLLELFNDNYTEEDT